MENFIKALFISLLTSGSFMTHASQQLDQDTAPWEANSAKRRNMTLQEYRELRPFLDSFERAEWKVQEEEDRKAWLRQAEDANEAWIREHAPKQLRPSPAAPVLPVQQSMHVERRTAQELQLMHEMQVREENEYLRLQTLRSEQLARRLEAEERAHHAAGMTTSSQIKPVYEDARKRETGDAELAQHLQREEQEALRKAEAALQRIRMENEDQRRQQQVHRRPEPKEIATFITQVNALSDFYATGINRPLLENYMRIFNDLRRVAQHADVHVLDSYVFGAQNNILFLVDIGNLFGIDNPALKLKEVGQQMIQFVRDHADIFANYKYINNPVTSASIISYLTAHFTNMDNEVGMCPASREIWSRAWTLALKLYEMKQDPQYIQIIFDQAIEGHLTRGGCIQGRINRGFVAYVILLGKAGVRLTQSEANK